MAAVPSGQEVEPLLTLADSPDDAHRSSVCNWVASGRVLNHFRRTCRITQDNVRYYIGIHTGSDGLQTNYGTRYSSEVHDFVVNAIATL